MVKRRQGKGREGDSDATLPDSEATLPAVHTYCRYCSYTKLSTTLRPHDYTSYSQTIQTAQYTRSSIYRG